MCQMSWKVKSDEEVATGPGVTEGIADADTMRCRNGRDGQEGQ